MKSTSFKKILIFSTFLIFNFGALAIGGLLMGGSPADNNWYLSLNKAPWTPPGWVFGFAWTSIMLCYSIFNFIAIQIAKRPKVVITLFIIQWLMNVIWNPLFFYFHLPVISLISLIILMLILFYSNLLCGLKSYINLFLFPYLIWLLIAFSLNLFIVIKN